MKRTPCRNCLALATDDDLLQWDGEGPCPHCDDPDMLQVFREVGEDPILTRLDKIVELLESIKYNTSGEYTR